MSKWYLYIVECADSTLYCGIALDVNKRITIHNLGKGAKYTRSKRPIKLLFTEEFSNHKDAVLREIEVKGLTREKKLKLIKENSVALRGLRVGLVTQSREKKLDLIKYRKQRK